ncbi:hypothetical protein [Salipiger thiooxidans]|uniref:hypothetical protein n=1 Tax=Salipiger thiooxidans TaxID=282683 RepID=UPI004056413F
MGSRLAFGDFQRGTRLPKAPQLQAFLDGSSPPLVQVLGQIVDMDAFGAFLRRFHADERKGDGTSRDFADELVGTQTEKSLATSSAGMIGRPEYIAIKRNAVFMTPE